MEKSKAETFIGFAVKAKKCKTGFNACCTLKRANLLIVCRSASDNTKSDVLKLSKKLHAPVYETVEKDLENIVFKENCKVMAITDFALASAVKEYATGVLDLVASEA